ncbi:hypothetical protein DL768_007615 [Monosporascus sp. mg162]|nr:hypothetical protein DL768_007615 [Monosporascus sp. mg162]
MNSTPDRSYAPKPLMAPVFRPSYSHPPPIVSLSGVPQRHHIGFRSPVCGFATTRGLRRTRSKKYSPLLAIALARTPKTPAIPSRPLHLHHHHRRRRRNYHHHRRDGDGNEQKKKRKEDARQQASPPPGVLSGGRGAWAVTRLSLLRHHGTAGEGADGQRWEGRGGAGVDGGLRRRMQAQGRGWHCSRILRYHIWSLSRLAIPIVLANLLCRDNVVDVI